MTRRATSLFVLGFTLTLLVLVAADVLLVIFAGLLVAVLLSGGGATVRRITHLPRAWSIAAFIILVLFGFTLAFLAFAPAAARQIDELATQLPDAFSSLIDRIGALPGGDHLLDRLRPSRLMSGEAGGMATAAVSSTFGALGNAVIILFIGLYGALDPDLYRRGLRAMLAPSLRARADEVMDEVGKTLTQWLGAQLISMTVVGVLTWLGLWLIGIPLAFILGLIAALLAFIPNIGPVIAAAPALLLAMPDGLSAVGMVVGVYLVVQTLESYLITPMIQQERVALPPVLIISAQLLFGVLFGLLGLALATPLAALGMTLFREIYIRDYLEAEPTSARSMIARGG